VAPSAASLGLGRGDSAEKFVMIVNKLDSALKLTHRNYSRSQEANQASARSQVFSPEKDKSSILNNNGLKSKPEGPPDSETIKRNTTKNKSSVSKNKYSLNGDTWPAEILHETKDDESFLKSTQDLSSEEPQKDPPSPKVSKVRQKRRQKMRLLYDSPDQIQ
jgi:hypothetical protein